MNASSLATATAWWKKYREHIELGSILVAMALGIWNCHQTQEIQSKERLDEVASLEEKYWTGEAELDALARSVDRLLDEAYPRNYRLLTLRGLIQSDYGRLEDAEDSFRSALREEARHLEALMGLGRILVINHEPGEAISILEKARNIAFEGERAVSDPVRQDVLLMLASAHLENRDVEQADKVLNSASEIQVDNPQIHKVRGNICRQERNYRCAERSFRLASEAMKGDESVTRSLSEVRQLLGQ